MKTIVVPLDGSDIAESVLPVVAELARLKLDVHLVWAVLLGAGLYTGPQPGGYPPDIVQVLKKNAETYLNQVSERLARDGLRVHTHVPLHYSASGAIVEYAHYQENAFIAMSTHGRSGVGRWALGSVTNAVVRSGDLPVLIVRPS